MTDYLDKLIARSQGRQEIIQPKLAALFEPIKTTDEPIFERNLIPEENGVKNQPVKTKTDINNAPKIAEQGYVEAKKESEPTVASRKSTSRMEPNMRVPLEASITEQTVSEVTLPIRKFIRHTESERARSPPTPQFEASTEPTSSQNKPPSGEVPTQQVITPKIISTKAEKLQQSNMQEGFESFQPIEENLLTSKDHLSSLPDKPSTIELKRKLVFDNLSPLRKEDSKKNYLSIAENPATERENPIETRPQSSTVKPLTDDKTKISNEKVVTFKKPKFYRVAPVSEINHPKTSNQMDQSRLLPLTKTPTSSSSPTVQITVGRLEIQGIFPTQTQPSEKKPSPHVMTLSEYLKKRSQGGNL